MPRFFCPALTSRNDRIEIRDPAEIHHITHVLRIKAGGRVMVFNPPDLEAEVLIESIESGRVCCQILTWRKPQIPAARARVILACAVPKKSKFELIIEKAAELGVSEIIPLKTERTIVSLEGDRLERKQRRHEAVALSAVKQSRQTAIPRIHPMTDFHLVLGEFSNSTQMIIPSLEAQNLPILRGLAPIHPETPVLILIGPEGDFTPQEYAAARAAGAIAVSLGSTVLRVETAAITALAAVIFHLNALNSPPHPASKIQL